MTYPNLSSSHRKHLTGSSGVTAIHKPMFRIQRDTSLTSIDVCRHALPICYVTTPANQHSASPATTVIGMRTEHIKVYSALASTTITQQTSG